jgi:hypothetical protein
MSPHAPAARGLSPRQRWLSLCMLVAVPYLRVKAERAYTARTGGDAARLGLLADVDEARARVRTRRPGVHAARARRHALAHAHPRLAVRLPRRLRVGR